MSRPLPYPGHTWSFTQHAVGLNASTLYGFLQCASQFEGQETGTFESQITAGMIAAGILTANERDGAPDAWRDYQQLLAELGLICSTKIQRILTVTDLGRMYVAGEVGFSELMGLQAFRYQYPNGQKSTIQARLRQELTAASIPIPDTLVELQVQRGILLKPGLLVLRVVLELLQASHRDGLTVDECQAFLLPSRSNGDWPLCLAEVIQHRKRPTDISNINRHARRNVQDWFKFLAKTDYFIQSDDGIELSVLGRRQADALRDFCTIHEDLTTFWIPLSFDIPGRLAWFQWFGQAPLLDQSILQPELNEEYIQQNYVGGPEEDYELEDVGRSSDGIDLSPVDLDHLGRNTQAPNPANLEELAERLRSGVQKRHAKALLHDRIVRDLAETFISQGATVLSDPNSIDLYARWPSSEVAIFEVKTVTRRSLQARLRAAVGQIQEYDYRYRALNGNQPIDKVVVLNADLDGSAWQRDFLSAHLGIGLLCKTNRACSVSIASGTTSSRYWDCSALAGTHDGR